MAHPSCERWTHDRLLLGYVRAQARQSHRALYAHLKAWLESASPSHV
ncbi:MAG TPA: hypothetical protein VF739_04930 [Ktedonobacterales bacterium]